MTLSENIIIERCLFSSRTSNAIQFGSETHADFRNILIKDCRIEHAGKAGIGITMNDGHVIENITFRNIMMKKVCTPFYISMTKRNGIGKIRNINFDNIECTDISPDSQLSARSPHGYWTSTINGLSEMHIENIVFKNVSLHYKGGINKKAESISPPDPPVDYQPRKLGIRPASGFYLRHAGKIKFYNITIKHEKTDMRPAIVLDDVDTILFDNTVFPISEEMDYHVLIRNSRGIVQQGNKIVLKDIQ